MAVLDLSPLRKFLERVRAASQSGARDIRLTTGEAMELTALIGLVLAERLMQPAAPPEPAVMDGGSLKKL